MPNASLDKGGVPFLGVPGPLSNPVTKKLYLKEHTP